jgi:hypothetical protein
MLPFDSLQVNNVAQGIFFLQKKDHEEIFLYRLIVGQDDDFFESGVE